MTTEELDREWTQDELREHVRTTMHYEVPLDEHLPQYLKFLTPAVPLTPEELEWVKQEIELRRQP